MPVTTPEVLITATDGLLLVHEPPVEAEVNEIVAPPQTEVAPIISAGIAPTVITNDVLQPVPNVYIIVVVPGVTPVTSPVVLTEATVVLLLLHVPPSVALVSAAVFPAQTNAVPDMDAGASLIVTTTVA